MLSLAIFIIDVRSQIVVIDPLSVAERDATPPDVQRSDQPRRTPKTRSAQVYVHAVRDTRSMLNATHQALGLMSALAVCSAADAGSLTCAGCALASVLGSRLPDLDQPGSRIHRRSPIERRSLAIGALGAVLRLPLRAFAVLASHRGATHWLTTAVLVTVALGVLAAPLGAPAVFVAAVGVGCGYVTHVLADACMPSGAPLFGPFSRRRVHLLGSRRTLRTGSPADVLIGIAAFGVVVVLALRVWQ